MSERSSWQRRGAWDGIAIPGRSGAIGRGGAGVVITPRHDLAVASVIGRDDDHAALIGYFASEFKIALPQVPQVVAGETITLIWAGPSQWLALSTQPDMPSNLARGLRDAAAVSDQSDARAIIRLQGAKVRGVLAKGCPVDLHHRAFRCGETAITAIAGIGVQLWWAEGDDALHIAVPRSMAGSFWSWLTRSAAEFGIDVAAPMLGSSAAGHLGAPSR